MTSLPTPGDDNPSNLPDDLEERLRALEKAGFLTLGTGSPRGAKRRYVLTEGPSLSQIVIQQRR